MMKEELSGELTPQDSLEQLLSRLYYIDNYAHMMPNFTSRSGTAGVLVTNETIYPETMQLCPSPNGYIIGTGNGSIWTMLDLFKPGVLPKGIISLDYDQNCILSGKVLIELAKRNITPAEAISYFFGVYNKEPTETGEYFLHTLDEIVDIARNIASKEQNPQFKQILIDAIEKGEFVHDMQLTRSLENKDRPPDIRRRKNITATIYKHWRTIVALAQEGSIFFAHSDASNEFSLSFIDLKAPDIKYLRNILYTSNLVDCRYKKDLNCWQRFNPNGESWYIFTSQYKDNYVLRASHQPPVFPDS